MVRTVFASLMAVLVSVTALSAQQDDVAWVQIEALPSLAEAQVRLRAYASRLPDVNGFRVDARWYAVALGPYTRQDAETARRVYVSRGLVPEDAYVTETATYRQQIWPVGTDYLAGTGRPPAAEPQPAPAAPAEAPQTEALPATAPGNLSQTPGQSSGVTGVTGMTPAPQPEALPQSTEPPPPPAPATDETPQQALAAEQSLSREERVMLQQALKWAGSYSGALDGLFGPGTRAAMRDWQVAQGYPGTGVLTTAQRVQAVQAFNAVFDGLGLEVVGDETAGIALEMPTELVSFDRYSYPFAQYRARTEMPVQVVLISRRGDRAALRALYDILQTLDMVPAQGPRAIDRGGFVLTGADTEQVSQTRVWLRDGMIKGFMLVWPTGDEARRTRVWERMEASFRSLDGALSEEPAEVSDQRHDLVSGLRIRSPRHTRTGYFVDPRGAVLTVSDIAEGCTRLTIDESDAEVIATDGARGLSLLRPVRELAPVAIAQFAAAPVALGQQVAAAGYSYGGMLGAPTVTFGTVADLRGLDGDAGINRLDLDAEEGDIGGPVMSTQGAVVGMLHPGPGGGRALPNRVALSTALPALTGFLIASGVPVETMPDAAPLPPEALTRKARGIAVLVECWE